MYERILSNATVDVLETRNWMSAARNHDVDQVPFSSAFDLPFLFTSVTWWIMTEAETLDNVTCADPPRSLS